MLGSRAVRIQLPTIRKPVKRYQKLTDSVFRNREKKPQNHKQAKQNLKAQQTKQQHMKKLTLRNMPFPLYTPTSPTVDFLSSQKFNL